METAAARPIRTPAQARGQATATAPQARAWPTRGAPGACTSWRATSDASPVPAYTWAGMRRPERDRERARRTGEEAPGRRPQAARSDQVGGKREHRERRRGEHRQEGSAARSRRQAEPERTEQRAGPCERRGEVAEAGKADREHERPRRTRGRSARGRRLRWRAASSARRARTGRRAAGPRPRRPPRRRARRAVRSRTRARQPAQGGRRPRGRSRAGDEPSAGGQRRARQAQRGARQVGCGDEARSRLRRAQLDHARGSRPLEAIGRGLEDRCERGCRRPSPRIAGERPGTRRRERAPEVGAHLCERARALAVTLGELGGRARAERVRTRHRLVQHHADRPDVGRRRRHRAGADLRCHVGERAEQPVVDRGVRPDEHRDAEVGELHRPVAAEQDVRRLDVAVHDARRVRVGEPGTGRRAGAQERRIAERPGTQGCAEIAAVDELGHDVDVVVVPGAVEQADDVRMVETTRDLDLALGPAAQRRVVRDRLDRDQGCRAPCRSSGTRCPSRRGR